MAKNDYSNAKTYSKAQPAPLATQLVVRNFIRRSTRGALDAELF